MGFEVLLTLTVLLICLVVMVSDWLRADLILLGGLAVLMFAGVVGFDAVVDGFANTTILALAALFVIARALKSTGALAYVGDFILGKTHNLRVVILRQSVAVSAISAFLNNTPVVAMGIPVVRGWAKEKNVDVSRLLMPLSFASILGGMCTLIGTSTNLVADGLLRGHEMEGLGFFELAWVGVPCAIAGWIYLVAMAPRPHGSHDEREVASTGERDKLWRRVGVPPAIVAPQPAASKSEVEQSEELGGAKMWMCVFILAAVVVLAATGIMHIAWGALIGVFMIVKDGILSPKEAVDAVDWEVLVIIAAAMGLGQAMEASGAAELIGAGVIALTEGFGPVGLLAGIIVASSILTQIITNNGAIALVFPIAVSVAASQGIDPRPLVLGATLGASLSFATPLSYQTNLMVYSAGDYSFGDFLRAGLPLQLLLTGVMVGVISLVWGL